MPCQSRLPTTDGVPRRREQQNRRLGEVAEWNTARMRRPLTVVAVLAAAGVSVGVRRWHTRWGATQQEVSERLPGDDVPLPQFGMTATRSITIQAPPEHVWPWITQLGFGKAGWYSYDILDNLGRPSATEILPQWQEVRPGDAAAPMNPFQPIEESPWRVRSVVKNETLLWQNDHSATWVWRLTALPDGATRLISRVRISYASASGLAFAPILEIADFPMYRRMLLGIKARAERLSTPN